MALQTIQGEGVWLPQVPWSAVNAPAFATTLTIDATGEKVAFCGRIFFPARTGTKTIDKVHFRFSAVTKSGGSGLTVSLQDISSSGAIMTPDESQDQFRNIANADGSFATNTWYSTGLITSDGTDSGSKRTVTYNDPIAIVIEFDGGGRLSSDTVSIAAVSGNSGISGCVSVLKTGSWGLSNSLPIVLLEFSDGSFGTLHGAFPFSATSTAAFKQDTAGADEYALEFQVPWPCKVDGAWVIVALSANTADFDLVLYEGTTAIATVAVPAEYAIVTSARLVVVGLPEVALTANTTYRLAVKPTQTTTNVTVHYIDVASANHMSCLPGGADFKYTTRLNEGSWASPTTTRRLMAGIRISAFDDGAGGGGMLYVPGMEGL